MPSNRIVPLIVAVALFMENMDSTVIATSLPAIAADIGTNPLALKLAVTSYLLSLAVFIPVSGWTADRFGARTVFRAAIAVFMLGSIGCALSGSLTQFVAARIVEGMGGAMMTPVGRLILVRSVDKRELVNAMVWVTMPALIGPLLGPPLGGFITTYISWHWIFLINIPIGLAGIVLATHLHRGRAGADARPVRLRSAPLLAGIGIGGLAFGGSVLGLDFLPLPVVLALIAVGAVATYAYVLHARRTPAPVLDLSLLAIPTMRAAVLGGFIYRCGIGAMPFLLPLLLQLGFGLTRVPVRPDHALQRGRRDGHEDRHPDHSAALRLQPGADRERADQRGAGRGLRHLHAGRAVRLDRRRAGGRRLLPLARIHQHQHHRLCRRRPRGA